MTQISTLLLLSAGFLVLFLIGEVLYHRYKVRAEYTRKFAHITVGLLALSFPYYLSSHWQVLILSSIFLIILLLAKRFKMLQHIHAVKRRTYGSYLYPPTVYGCFLLGSYKDFTLYFYIPILVMAVSDPVAALTGSKWGKKITGKEFSKTFLGSLMFFLSAIIATLILIVDTTEYSPLNILFISFLVGAVGMFAEVISYKGWDNFTIPLAVVILMLILSYFQVV